MVVVAPQHDVVAVAAVECLAVVALNQDVGVTEVDVAEYQLDVAAVVVVVVVVAAAVVVAAVAAVAAVVVVVVAHAIVGPRCCHRRCATQ